MTKTVYVSVLEYWYDDYKRPEAKVSVLGVFTSKSAAYACAWKQEMLKNYENCENVSDPPYYYFQIDRLDTLTDRDIEDLERTWAYYLMEALGNAEFTSSPGGYTARVYPI